MTRGRNEYVGNVLIYIDEEGYTWYISEKKQDGRFMLTHTIREAAILRGEEFTQNTLKEIKEADEVPLIPSFPSIIKTPQEKIKPGIKRYRVVLMK